MLFEKLQLDSELTLESAVTQVRLQQSVVRGGTRVKQDSHVNVVSQVEPHQQSRGRANKPRDSRGPRTLSNNQSNGACSKCGLTPFNDSARCPAREAVCRRCKKRGHYQRVCRSHIKVTMVEEGQDAFLGTLGSQNSGDTWQVKEWLNNTSVRFQIDTGAEVTVIPTSVHSKLNGANMRPLQRNRRGRSQCTLPVLG